MSPDSDIMDVKKAGKKYKIGVLYQGPALQISSQYDALSELQDFEFFFLYMNERQRNPAWKPSFPKNAGYEFLPDPAKFWPSSLRYNLNANIMLVLKKHNFDAMILHCIYDNSAVWQCIWWCKRNRKPYLLRTDANVTKEKGWFRKAIRKLLISKNISDAAALLCIGTQNKKYYKLYGARQEQFFLAPWEIDYDSLQGYCQAALLDRENLRKKLQIDENDCVIITISRLLEWKGYHVIIPAIAKLAQEGLKVKLIIVGEGPYRSKIEEIISKYNAPVHLCGHLDRKGVVDSLVASDIFALASYTEPWGLVVNEAAICGLPIVLSSAVGAATDLLQPGENGYVFPSGDINSLVESLRPLVLDKALRTKMGNRSLELISQWRNNNPAIAGYQKALNAVFACKG